MSHWVEREFTGHDFRDDDLRGLPTERCVFSECDFSGVDLSESEHVGSAQALAYAAAHGLTYTANERFRCGNDR